MSKIGNIQILRALAALMVVFFHLLVSLENDFGYFDHDFFSVGAFGVDIFFVISGFIICLTTQANPTPLSFLIKRAIRIIPLYYALTLFLFLIALILPGLLNSTTADPGALVKSLLFIPYEGVNGTVQPLLFLGWSLNFEMFFYLIFGLTLLFKNRASHICLTILFVLYIVGKLFSFETVVISFFLFGIILEFGFGILIYMIVSYRPQWLKHLTWALPLGIILFFAQNILGLTEVTSKSVHYLVISGPRELIRGIPAALVVLGALAINPLEGKIAHFFNRLGDASYSLYLLHPYVIQAAVKVIVPVLGVSIYSVIGVVFISVIISISASFILYKYFENPIDRFLRRQILT